MADAADFLFMLLVGSLMIVGIWNAFAPGEILGVPGEYIASFAPKWVMKPLFDCPPCQASVWGTILWFVTGHTWVYWPLYVVCLSGLMKLLVLLVLDRHTEENSESK